MPWEHGQRRPATREDVVMALRPYLQGKDNRHEVDSLVQAVNRLSFHQWEAAIKALGVEPKAAREVWRSLAYPPRIH